MMMEEENSEYVVRRLTPLECERLQGYPDGWCTLPVIEDMTDEEFEWWNETRKMSAEALGKKYKPFKNKKQAVKWYNKMNEADGHKYKAMGNSIALPQWWWLFNRMKEYLPEDAKLGSLFDGVGGFPLMWEETFGAGTARWASEIEEFPIAVTRYRFPEPSENNPGAETEEA